jgi:hypothetical protein
MKEFHARRVIAQLHKLRRIAQPVLNRELDGHLDDAADPEFVLVDQR